MTYQFDMLLFLLFLSIIWHRKCTYAFKNVYICSIYLNVMLKYFLISKYVTLEHKSSHKLPGYICSNNQQYIVWVKIIDFHFMPKIIK